MKRLLFLAIAALITTGAAQARTLELAFLPPAVEPQDLCIPGSPDAMEDDLSTEQGEDGLTDRLRLRYLDRDIRNLSAEDADRWFDFISDLIDWRATVDPDFAGNDALLAKIALHVDAGRLEALQAAELVDQLRNGGTQISYGQKVALAQYYLNGIGVAKDLDYAVSLIRDAAYGGNAEALLSIARMELQGAPVPDWDAPLDLTVTLAFGGMLGQMNAQVCDHAERIAREYMTGDVVTHNPDVAYAWYKFAADLGGAQAAWRIVEFHLEADAARKDNEEMLKYLRLAVQRGITLEDGQVARVKSAGQIDEATLRQILGYNFSADTGRGRPSLSPYLQLSVNLDGDEADEDGPYLQYLRELTQIDTAPGWVFTTLANEVVVRKGRWAGEPEALDLLEEAALRLDPEGMQMLANRLVRQRDDPAQINRAINLLNEAVSRFGLMPAMRDLDTLYRCQDNNAPLLPEADLWARNYRASLDKSVEISPTDLISLDPHKKPEILVQLQTQALMGRPEPLARFLERLQLDPWATDNAHRMWALRASQSDKALEVFAELEFALATNPAERDLSVELFRRVYLNNGVTSALDLAIALTEDDSRVDAIATEIVGLLTKAGNRGEGAAIRLLAQLTAGTRTAQSVFDEFEQVIDERGDFLALMFAIPFIDNDQTDDYIDRAVSLMTCGTKDADELGDAYAILLSPDLTYHWRRIGLAIEGGHVLAKLALSDTQVALYGTGAAPTARDVQARNLGDGDETALRSLFALTSDPDAKTYDPLEAAEHLLAILERGSTDDEAWVLDAYRRAAPAVQTLIGQKINIADVYQRATRRGDVTAKLDYGLMLRATATKAADLSASARWLKEAAEGGNVEAMAELGQVLAYGIGVPQDRRGGLIWLEKAAQAGDPTAKEAARLMRLESAP